MADVTLTEDEANRVLAYLTKSLRNNYPREAQSLHELLTMRLSHAWLAESATAQAQDEKEN